MINALILLKVIDYHYKFWLSVVMSINISVTTDVCGLWMSLLGLDLLPSVGNLIKVLDSGPKFVMNEDPRMTIILIKSFAQEVHQSSYHLHIYISN